MMKNYNSPTREKTMNENNVNTITSTARWAFIPSKQIKGHHCPTIRRRIISPKRVYLHELAKLQKSFKGWERYSYRYKIKYKILMRSLIKYQITCAPPRLRNSCNNNSIWKYIYLFIFSLHWLMGLLLALHPQLFHVLCLASENHIKGGKKR